MKNNGLEMMMAEIAALKGVQAAEAIGREITVYLKNGTTFAGTIETCEPSVKGFTVRVSTGAGRTRKVGKYDVPNLENVR